MPLTITGCMPTAAGAETACTSSAAPVHVASRRGLFSAHPRAARVDGKWFEHLFVFFAGHGSPFTNVDAACDDPDRG